METSGLGVQYFWDLLYTLIKKTSLIETKEQMYDWLDEVNGILQKREEEYLALIGKSEVHVQAFSPVVFVADSLSRLQQSADSKIHERLAMMMKRYSHLGFSVIVAGNANEFTKGFDVLTTELKQIRQAILVMKKSEQSLFALPFTRHEPEVDPGFGHFVVNGKEQKIQIPKVE
jgi:DNA segregation ATPase FtsK/SpoIIIE, S-DNA-T family